MMQGRLSPIIDNRIQTFPTENWEQEIQQCSKLGIKLIEWTVDTLTFSQNPILQESANTRVNSLLDENKIEIPSVTCDYYMENPHWNSNNVDIERDVIRIIEAMSQVGAHILVIPLVDNSSISNKQDFDMNFFNKLENYLRKNNIRIAFELDLDPDIALDFIDSFNPEWFGINYDIGNSASLGLNPVEEITNYGHRILNVHVKDRLLGGSTVRLGLGNADFRNVVEELDKINYPGNFIMQTARAIDGNHTDELVQNIDFFKRVLNEY